MQQYYKQVRVDRHTLSTTRAPHHSNKTVSSNQGRRWPNRGSRNCRSGQAGSDRDDSHSNQTQNEKFNKQTPAQKRNRQTKKQTRQKPQEGADSFRVALANTTVKAVSTSYRRTLYQPAAYSWNPPQRLAWVRRQGRKPRDMVGRRDRAGRTRPGLRPMAAKDRAAAREEAPRSTPAHHPSSCSAAQGLSLEEALHCTLRAPQDTRMHETCTNLQKHIFYLL